MCIPACNWTITPPRPYPIEMAIEVGGTRPSVMHFCLRMVLLVLIFYLFFEVAHLGNVFNADVKNSTSSQYARKVKASTIIPPRNCNASFNLQDVAKVTGLRSYRQNLLITVSLTCRIRLFCDDNTQL